MQVTRSRASVASGDSEELPACERAFQRCGWRQPDRRGLLPFSSKLKTVRNSTRLDPDLIGRDPSSETARGGRAKAAQFRLQTRGLRQFGLPICFSLLKSQDDALTVRLEVFRFFSIFFERIFVCISIFHIGNRFRYFR